MSICFISKAKFTTFSNKIIINITFLEMVGGDITERYDPIAFEMKA